MSDGTKSNPREPMTALGEQLDKVSLLADTGGLAWRQELIVLVGLIVGELHELRARVDEHRTFTAREAAKTDNAPENIEVCGSIAEHRAKHRKPGSNRRLPGEDNPEVQCVCGCGDTFKKFDRWGRPRRGRPGHEGRERGDEGRFHGR